MSEITPQQVLQLQRLRLRIARVGQSDSMNWWEDDSLTTNGAYLLERLFPGAPDAAGRKLALAAATSRHQAALAHLDHANHLFRLAEESRVKLILRDLKDTPTPDHLKPLNSIDSLHDLLRDITNLRPEYEVVHRFRANRTMEIRLVNHKSGILDQATALAWAYLEGDVGDPVFPYIVKRG
jgi:hypothetical protein